MNFMNTKSISLLHTVPLTSVNEYASNNFMFSSTGQNLLKNVLFIGNQNLLSQIIWILVLLRKISICVMLSSFNLII